MAGTTPVPSARPFSFHCAGAVCSARGLCGLLVVFPASSVDAVCGKPHNVKSYYRFLHKSRMVLTRSMATTNDIQEEEPPTTALERQVKTLAAAVERLTRQNHDLEEQLRQKNAAPDNQGADQEGTSVDRRNQEGPQASNAPSKPDRQNMSIPFLAETTPPIIIAEMQAMKEQMEVMMNALKGRVSSDLDDLVNRTDSPFTATVNSYPLPSKFCMPQIDSYDGVKDPLDHLETFKTLMHLQGVADAIMCRAFLMTLKGVARIWFSRLTLNSISTFKELNA